MPKPWETLVEATYAKLKNVHVLFCRTGLEGKGRWIAPGQAVVVDEEEEGGREEDVESAKRLCKVRVRVCACMCVRERACVGGWVWTFDNVLFRT